MEKSIDLAGFIKQNMNISAKDINTYSPLTLAFIGDSIYDLVIRTFIVEKVNAPVNKLHKEASSYVNAKSQAKILHGIENILTKEEQAVYRRGRNAKSYTSAKNASIIDYRIATGFEALIGYLYLIGDIERIMEITKKGIDIIDNV